MCAVVPALRTSKTFLFEEEEGEQPSSVMPAIHSLSQFNNGKININVKRPGRNETITERRREALLSEWALWWKRHRRQEHQAKGVISSLQRRARGAAATAHKRSSGGGAPAKNNMPRAAKIIMAAMSARLLSIYISYNKNGMAPRA